MLVWGCAQKQTSHIECCRLLIRYEVLRMSRWLMDICLRRLQMSSRHLLPLLSHQQPVSEQAGLVRRVGCVPLCIPERHQEGLLPGQRRLGPQPAPPGRPPPLASLPSALCPSQLAKKYHPDTNPDEPDAKEKFAQLAEAYEVPTHKRGGAMMTVSTCCRDT